MKLAALLVVLIIHQASYGQGGIDTTSTESGQSIVRRHSFHKQSRWAWIVPSTLIAAGTLLTLDKDSDGSNYMLMLERNEDFKHFHTHVDNYLQYAPIAAAFAMSLSGVKGKSDLPNQLALFVKSELLMGAVVYPIKRFAAYGRPDTGAKNSFPSGHTAQAFVAATFLAKEYGYKSKWISIGGYTTATVVASLRLLNDRHWLSDVVAGAGIGILCTELVYATHQYKWGKKMKSVSLFPSFQYGSKGIGFTMQL